MEVAELARAMSPWATVQIVEGAGHFLQLEGFQARGVEQAAIGQAVLHGLVVLPNAQRHRYGAHCNEERCVGAGQRNALARQLLASGKGLTRDGLTLDILTIEDALPTLMSGAANWDAIIAMPDLRSIVFTLLAHASGVSRAWPMLWIADDNARSLRVVTSEAPGEGASRLPLDAAALVQALDDVAADKTSGACDDDFHNFSYGTSAFERAL